jgi:nitronate monooxygenase
MIATRLTRMLDLQHPIVLAPMGGVAGGRLAAAVSNAGGLGLVGGGYGDAAWLRAELAHAAGETNAGRPWGVGVITWSTTPAVLELALGFRPRAFMLSFGDPRPYASAIKAAGCTLICQVQGLPEARLAVEAGADIVVAQGTEGGGHGGGRGTLALVPAIVDAVASIPVLAAGGIADGRGVAAALMLGAEGALIGTRFYASTEALGHANAKQRLVEAGATDTLRTRVFDVVRGYPWPRPYTGRALRNRFVERWHGQEEALTATVDTERADYHAAAARGDCDTAVVWASEAIDLIRDIDAAGALVQRIAAEAEARLRTGVDLLR